MRSKLVQSENTYMYKQTNKPAFLIISNQCTMGQSFLAKALITHFGICSLKLIKAKHLQQSCVTSSNDSCPVLVELRFEQLYLKKTKMKEKSTKLAKTFSPMKLGLTYTPECNDSWHLHTEKEAIFIPRPPSI